MIKGVFGINKLFRWFRCVILDRHEYSQLPLPPNYEGKCPVEIHKCRFCGGTRCDYL